MPHCLPPPPPQPPSPADERSLGFYALGHGRATGRPAVVITSSGTAVANLLPAAVEAAQSGVPLLLVTGDRPAELRDSGANQTIDQVRLLLLCNLHTVVCVLSQSVCALLALRAALHLSS